MSGEEATKILLEMLKPETDMKKREAIDIALDSIAAVDRLKSVIDSYVGRS